MALAPGSILIAKINRVFYYTDATGVTVVGPYKIIRSGVNIGQDQPPSRVVGEFVGTYTGKRQSNSKGQVFLEVDWVNSFTAKRTSILKGPYDVNQRNTSWVKEAEVEYSENLPDTTGDNDSKTGTGNGGGSKDPAIDPKTGKPFLPGPGPLSEGLIDKSSNNTTLYVIIGVAVLLVGGLLFFLFKSPKSKKK